MSMGRLIQGISHNCDAYLCTQNGLQQTHALASIICQPSSPDDDKMKREDTTRLKKQQDSIEWYWNKNPCWAEKAKNASVVSKVWSLAPQSSVLLNHHTGKSKQRGLFIPQILHEEFSGYNTTRETGPSLKAKVYYRPLISKTLNTVNNNVQFGEDFKGCWSVILNVNMWPAVVPSAAGCNLGKSTALDWTCSVNWWYALDHEFRWECGQIDRK